MALNIDLVSQFAKLTATKKETKKESTAWGEVVEITASGKCYVKLDGSDRVTPVETVTEAKVGDRVSVTIKNHAATLTGNTSSPSINADGSTVGTIKNDFKNLSADNLLIRGELIASSGRIDSLTAKNVKIEETLEAHTGKFANLEADVAEFERLSATFATFDQLTAKEAEFRTVLADYATIENLSATNAKIVSLEAEDANIRNLFANYAKIADLETDYAKITELNAVKGNITTLNAEVATINTALVGYATIAQLEAGYATIASLDAVDAKVGNLNAEVGEINTLIFDFASGSSVQTSFANAVVALIGDAQINSAMIKDLSTHTINASQIIAGDIITDNVKVKSKDGKLLIADQTIQISDNTRVRVQIGKDAVNDYSINIWDANGKLMFSEGGLTEDAVKEQIIRNDMVKDDANISASKLDIDTLFNVINEDGSHTLKSNKIKLDEENQTLDIAFGALTTKVDGISVGGRNLIAGTSLDTVYSGVVAADSTLGYKDVWSAKTINNADLTEYIVSFDAKADEEIDIRCFFYMPNTTLTSESSTGDHRGNAETAITDGVSVVHITNEWKRYWVKWTQTPANAKKSVIVGRHTSTTNNVYIRAVKLEAGNKATDWTPAPEDVDGALTTLDSKYSSLKVTVDGFDSIIAAQNQTIAAKADGSTVETLSSQYSTLNQTVTGLSSTVGQHTTQIAAKADGSTVAAVSNRMTTLESNLEGFKSNVSETYTTKSDFNGLASRVSTAETGLAQTKNDLTLYAKNTEVTQTLSGYYTAAQTDAQIKISSDAISQKVSSLETEFNDLSIGGRNLLLNTAGSGDVVMTNGATVVTASLPTRTNENGIQTFTGSATGAEVYYRFMVPNANNLYGLEPGETYILSGKAKVTTTSGTFDYFSTRTQYNPGGGWSGGAATVILREDSDEWVDFETKFTIESNATGYYVSLQLYYTGSWAGTIQLKELKLEKGNKRTDWTPAPEDAVKDITSLAARMTTAETGIKQTTKDLTLYAKNTEVTQTLSGYYTKAQTDSAIDVASNSITQTVSSTYATKTALNDVSDDLTGLTDDFNNLSIGGRNLIAGTSKDEIALGGYPASGYTEGKTGKTIDIPNGDEYVLSFEAKSTVAGDKIDCHFYSPNTTLKVITSTNPNAVSNAADGYAILPLTTGWKRYWVKYTQNGANTTATKSWIVGRRRAGMGTGSISVRAIKLEAGNKATEWTPAPEDATTEFVTVRSEIKQLADSIKLEVTSSAGSKAGIKITAGDNTKETELPIRAAFANDPTAIDISAGTVTFKSNTFVVDSTYFKVSSTGIINATGGAIGGMELHSRGIYSYHSSYPNGYGGLYSISGAGYNGPCFFAGAADMYGSNAKFYVTHAGKLHAGDAEINGDVTTVSGKQKAELTSGELTFYYDDAKQGLISSKYHPNATSYGLTLRIPSYYENSLTSLTFVHENGAEGSGYVVDYQMHNFENDGVTGSYDNKETNARHAFWGGMRLYGGLYVSGQIYPTGMIYLRNQCAIGWYGSGNSGPHQLISFDSSNILNIGSSSYDTTIKSHLNLEGVVRLRNNYNFMIKNSGGTALAILALGSDNHLYIGKGLQNNGSSNMHVYSGRSIYLYNYTDEIEFVYSTNDTYSAFFRPGSNGTCTLGASNNRWYRMYAKYDCDISSDRRLKENITSLSDIHSELFDKLQPVQYNFIDGDGRTHYGLIAQDVVAAMEEMGMQENDLDLVNHSFHVNEENGELNDTYGMAYTNLIPMLIHEVQKLKQKIKILEGE